ncbi:MAG: prephenate dehydratase [Lachnospiraceae bacterium]|nr:prephenate dehydratase [Lachnospiraceae bacterium]
MWKRGYIVKTDRNELTEKNESKTLDLGEIRNKIDEVDAAIVEEFEKRMRLCKEVAQFKIDNGKNVLDKERELQKIEKVASLAKNDFNRQSVKELFTQIMAISRKLQYQILTENGMSAKIEFKEVEGVKREDITVVYQGVPGAYSHQAMLNYFGKDTKNYHVSTFREAMEAVSQGKADYAVLPIENSTAGTVNDVYDLLFEFDNYIVATTDVIVKHALLGTNDAAMEDIEVVYSHPQGLMQCNRFLEEHREWQQVSQANTAASAKKVMEKNDKRYAAIASTIAAEIYGLKVLGENINRNSENTTRFIIVGKEKVYRKDASKVFLLFEISHTSGSLYNTLSHFIYNGINMTSIESRPIKEKKWEYRFYVELDGNLKDLSVINAINGLMEETSFVKIIGNY